MNIWLALDKKGKNGRRRGREAGRKLADEHLVGFGQEGEERKEERKGGRETGRKLTDKHLACFGFLVQVHVEPLFQALVVLDVEVLEAQRNHLGK
jgi:hypothetical protein